MLKRNRVVLLSCFFSKRFDEKFKQAEVSLYFIKKQYFCLKTHFTFIWNNWQHRDWEKSCFLDFDFVRVLWDQKFLFSLGWHYNTNRNNIY